MGIDDESSHPKVCVQQLADGPKTAWMRSEKGLSAPSTVPEAFQATGSLRQTDASHEMLEFRVGEDVLKVRIHSYPNQHSRASFTCFFQPCQRLIRIA